MNRRGFLKSFGALAACLVVGPTLAKATPTDMARFAAQARNGIVSGETFVITEPIVIDIGQSLTIRDCLLMFNLKDSNATPIVLKGGGRLHVDHCEMEFESRHEFIFKAVDDSRIWIHQCYFDTNGAGIAELTAN